MARRVHDLTPSALDSLPSPCRSCLFWESTTAGPGIPPAGEAAGAQGKEAWWQATQLEWGTPGKGVWNGDELIGFATFGPPGDFPRRRRLGHGTSDDALLLATLWVQPAHRGQGVATLLLHSVLREAHRHNCRALEAYSSRQPALCLVPEGFLLASGFQLLHEHLTHPLLRLDLRQTAKETVGAALEGVLSALGRRERIPAPARPALEHRRPVG